MEDPDEPGMFCSNQVARAGTKNVAGKYGYRKHGYCKAGAGTSKTMGNEPKFTNSRGQRGCRQLADWVAGNTSHLSGSVNM